MLSKSCKGLKCTSTHFKWSRTYKRNPPSLPSFLSFLKTWYPGIVKAVLGDDSVNHDSERKRKSSFESVSKISICSVFEDMPLILKCPPSSPLGFIRLSHRTLAWFTGLKSSNFLLKCPLHVRSLRLEIAFCRVALEDTNRFPLPRCNSVAFTNSGVSNNSGFCSTLQTGPGLEWTSSWSSGSRSTCSVHGEISL